MRTLRLAPDFRRLALALALLGGAARLAAMIFYACGDANYNTTAPTGSLTNSGWQWQGYWHGFCGTPIGTNLFITAQHVGGAVGTTFSFAGTDYRTVARFADTNSDLVIWQVCGTFPSFAPLYQTGDEIYRSCVVFGRGVTRGGEVTVTNNGTAAVRGWHWGAADDRLRWGVNKITALSTGGIGTARLLVAPFDRNGGANVAALGSGDSGGAVFINNSGWRLAGINFAVDGPYNYVANGPGFFAALFDASGLYDEVDTNVWKLVATAQPSAFYATRIFDRLAWIRSVIAAHDGQQPAPALEAAAAVTGPFTPVTNAVVNTSAQTITVPVPARPQFYRLNGCVSFQLNGATISGGRLVLTWTNGG